MFKERERYYIYNPSSDNNGYFLTIVKICKEIVYYFFDGDDEVKYFEKGSNFEVDLIKLG